MGDQYIQRCPYPYKKLPNVDAYTFLKCDFGKNEKKLALKDCATGQRCTYGQLEQTVENVAYNLEQLGLKKGQNVAFYITNCMESVIVMLATWRLGAAVSGINSLLTPSETLGALDLCKAEYLFLDKSRLLGLNKVSSNLSAKVIVKEESAGSLSYSMLLRPRPSDHNVTMVYFEPREDTAIINLTSGTTGKPKAVNITHTNLVSLWLTGLPPEISPVRNAITLFLPLAHTIGYWLLGMGLYLASPILIMSRFDVETFLTLMSTYKVESIVIVPPVAVMLAQHPSVDKYDLSNLRAIHCGGAPLALSTQLAIEKQLGSQIEIRQYYGLTEAGAVLLMPFTRFISFDSPTSLGYPVLGCEAKVVDDKTGQSLPANQIGELLVRSPSVMEKYLDNPKATAEAIDADGWFHTGDIMYYDENGLFFVVDRKKELIKYNAYQVSPSELEDILLSHSGVADAAVIGIPDKFSGELPLGFVVKKPGALLKEDEIIKYIADRVASFKRLRGGVRFVSSIPKSPSGKTLKLVLKKELQTGKL